MADDYLRYWEFNRPPFALTPDPEMLYMSSQHSECLMRLKYAVFSQKGGALLVSDNAGNGKTSALARLRRDLDDYYGGRVRVVFIDHPTLTPIEMIGEIAHQLGAELNTSEKLRALNLLSDRLYALYNENIKVVVIVDEGQMLKDRPDLLGELRILLNFCVADAFLLTFIFSGQKPLDAVLRAMPEFWQRLPVRFFLRNLDFKDTRELVRFRIAKAGGSPDIFTDDAFEGIYRFSEGCPRVICSVADLCLVVGYAKGVRRVGFVEVSTACRDMETSGDGFHYYAFLAAQKDIRPNPERQEPIRSESERQAAPGDRPPAESVNAPPQPSSQASDPKKNGFASPVGWQADNRPPMEQAATAAQRNSMPRERDPGRPAQTDTHATPRHHPGTVVTCSACGGSVDAGLRFCPACGAALYRKCIQCRTLIETFTGECPVCGADCDAVREVFVSEIRRRFEPFDVLEDTYATWLEGCGIALAKGERVLAGIPRGGRFSSGPTVASAGDRELTAGERCDLVITDRRIICNTPAGMHDLVLERVDTCRVLDTGGITARRFLLVGAGGRNFRVFPNLGRKSKQFCDIVAEFVTDSMLR